MTIFNDNAEAILTEFEWKGIMGDRKDNRFPNPGVQKKGGQDVNTRQEK